jgi:uncharacterized protein with GYD domain
MPKYLIDGNYVGESSQNSLKEDSTGRYAAIEKLTRSLSGKVESVCYAFGETDIYVIVDIPHLTNPAAVSLAASASGAVKVKTTVLLPPEEETKRL